MAFQLKPNRKETENKTIRFPLQLIERIDKAIENSNYEKSIFYKKIFLMEMLYEVMLI